jgi:hypothetical protein
MGRSHLAASEERGQKTGQAREVNWVECLGRAGRKRRGRKRGAEQAKCGRWAGWVALPGEKQKGRKKKEANTSFGFNFGI